MYLCVCVCVCVAHECPVQIGTFLCFAKTMLPHDISCYLMSRFHASQLSVAQKVFLAFILRQKDDKFQQQSTPPGLKMQHSTLQETLQQDLCTHLPEIHIQHGAYTIFEQAGTTRCDPWWMGTLGDGNGHVMDFPTVGCTWVNGGKCT